jgi:hypothetical protein
MLRILRKCVEKTDVSLQSDNNNGRFTLMLMYIYDYISLNSSNKVVEKIETHILCSITFFLMR